MFKRMISRLLRRRRDVSEEARPIWSGVYPSFDEMPASDSPYASAAAIAAAERLLHWMIDAGHLEDVARASGYRIALQRRLERVYDQSDFPAELRMERATTLLFERHP